MKSSKRFVVLAAVAIGGILASPQGFAQNNEAVNADDILSPKTAPSKNANRDVLLDAKNNLEKGLVEAKKENEDKDILAKKIELAKKMHHIRPTRVQVDAAVKRAAQNLPSFERQNFIVAMQSMLNYNAIERISIDAMVETYTLAELKAMVDYFSRPEAVSASAKMESWAKAVQPEIIRMIDRAMMRIKTGQ